MLTAIIQARMASKRLPGKVLKQVNGKPLLYYLCERIKFVSRVKKIIIATSTVPFDDPVEQFCQRFKITCFRGSENNVLERFYFAAQTYKSNPILRITADCPLLDPKLLEQLIDFYDKSSFDYVYFGSTFAEGMCCDMFSFNALERTYRNATTDYEREHITPYMHKKSTGIKKGVLEHINDDSKYRITVDEPEDFEVVSSIIDALYSEKREPFAYTEIIDFLEKNKKLHQKNINIIRDEGFIQSLKKSNNDSRRTIILRADGSNTIGSGHIMRCIAFARGLEKIGVSSIFITKQNDYNYSEIIQKKGFPIEFINKTLSSSEEIDLTLKVMNDHDADMIVTDLSNSDYIENSDRYLKFLKAMKHNNKYVITFDGISDDSLSIKTHVPSDIVIIPYFNVDESNYKVNHLLAGPQYFVCRPEFMNINWQERKIRQKASHVLITMGGSDPYEFSLKVAQALIAIQHHDIHVRFIIGAGFSLQLRNNIEKIVNEFPGDSEIFIASDSMANHFSWADIAVINSGLTTYEAILTGTPGLILSLNKSHETTMNELTKLGCALHLGNGNLVTALEISRRMTALLDDYQLRMHLSKTAAKLIDGKGIDRILTCIPKEYLL